MELKTNGGISSFENPALVLVEPFSITTEGIVKDITEIERSYLYDGINFRVCLFTYLFIYLLIYGELLGVFIFFL